jgi:hypothetical protein
MSTHLADADVLDIKAPDAPSGAPLRYDQLVTAEDDRLNGARGIVLALVISCPCWALLALGVYLLL